ncbi:MAG TPA: protoporphyrinogen oxidase [Streptosporangiaceae bacterium]|nr:protoporphyrinogen oxidase [Streptosporangiaceae bacterium]
MDKAGQDSAGAAPHVVVVGGGIAGLTAAFFLRDEPVRLTVLEGSSRVGGKLLTAPVAGVAVDQGAESTYAGRPEATELITAAGLGDQITSPAVTARAIWTRGEIRPLPERQFMGVPSDMEELAKSGLLSSDGLDRARQDLELPSAGRDGDVSVASYIAGRFGQEVVDRITDPWLGSVFAGSPEQLSFEATLTPLARTSRKYASLAEAARRLLPRPRPGGEKPPTDVATLTGGLGNLPEVLRKAVLDTSPEAVIRTGATVTGLARSQHGWRVTVGPASDPDYLPADAVIVALPAGPASSLLTAIPGTATAASGLAEIPYADQAIVTLAYPREAFAGGLARRGLSSYLTPAVDGRAVKSVIFMTVKWPHLAGEVEIVRSAIGGADQADLLKHDDADLIKAAATELAEATGVTGEPVASTVTRWDSALPLYTVGHLDRVARIRACVASQPGLAVCGAAYDGLGIRSCVTTARSAVDQVLASVLTDTALTRAS